MELIKQVAAICERLAPFGWGQLFRRHGLNILAGDLRAELYRDISKSIDRSIPGFTDFAHAGFSGIHPYNPAMSLLYHALASPNVHPGTGHSSILNNAAYPTLDDLDVIENYIFSADHLPVGTIVRDRAFFVKNFPKQNLFVGVFAYQYRPGSKTVHGRYADTCYSRTGISRLGTRPHAFKGSSRSFWPVDSARKNDFRVMPARYGLFLAEKREISVEGEVMLSQKNDKDEYFFPLHKLFPGDHCIAGLKVPPFTYQESHLSEKLRLLFVSLKIPSPFNLNKPPFVRTSNPSDLMVRLDPRGSSVLVVPEKTKNLIEYARQNGKIIHFTVLPMGDDPDRRFSTSLQNENNSRRFPDARVGPEYANIRFELKKNNKIQNISSQFRASKEKEFLKKINDGDYEAAVFSDNSCDGCIEVKFTRPFALTGKSFPAYSLVAAPDFFPLCDQSDIANWEADNGIKDQFREGGSDPLFTTRQFINPEIQSTLVKASAFDALNQHRIKTTTAMVSMSVLPSSNPGAKNNEQQVSWLTDAGSGVFAPGWDVSLVTIREYRHQFLSTAGLGSPFPEDSKLCAALNSFWPAVAPDASRTFIAASVAPGGYFKTAMPLLDEELGYHPQHPAVLSGAIAASSTGWDGEQGAFFEDDYHLVNYCSLDRSDYTANMLRKSFTMEKLSLINSAEWIDRMIALRNCIFVLPPAGGDHVSTTRLSVISVQKVKNWDEVHRGENARLSGPGYIMEFAKLTGEEILTKDRKRRQRRVEQAYICQLSDRYLFWKIQNATEFNEVNRGTIPLKW